MGSSDAKPVDEGKPYREQSEEWRRGYDEAEHVYHRRQADLRREMRQARSERDEALKAASSRPDATTSEGVAVPLGPPLEFRAAPGSFDLEEDRSDKATREDDSSIAQAVKLPDIATRLDALDKKTAALVEKSKALKDRARDATATSRPTCGHETWRWALTTEGAVCLTCKYAGEARSPETAKPELRCTGRRCIEDCGAMLEIDPDCEKHGYIPRNRERAAETAPLAVAVADHCAAYVADIGDCLACTLQNEMGKHEDFCPVGRYMAASNRERATQQTSEDTDGCRRPFDSGTGEGGPNITPSQSASTPLADRSPASAPFGGGMHHVIAEDKAAALLAAEPNASPSVRAVDLSRAALWLSRNAAGTYADNDHNAQRLANLIADVRHETIEACAAAAEEGLPPEKERTEFAHGRQSGAHRVRALLHAEHDASSAKVK